MTDETWRPPTVASTIRKYALQSGFAGALTPGKLVRLAVLLVVMALLIPKVNTDSSIFGYIAFATVFGAADAAFREHQLGGPRRIEIAAGLTTATCFLLAAAVFVVASILLGPEAGSSPLEGFLDWLTATMPHFNPVTVLAGLAVILVIRYLWIDRPTLERDRAASRAEAKVERAARAAAFGGNH